MKERTKDKEALDRRQQDSAVLDYDKPDEPFTKAGFEPESEKKDGA